MLALNNQIIRNDSNEQVKDTLRIRLCVLDDKANFVYYVEFDGSEYLCKIAQRIDFVISIVICHKVVLNRNGALQI